MSTGEIAVIFDMDGVLIDSVGRNWQVNNQVLANYGINVPDEKLHRYVGRTLSAQVQMLSEDFGKEIDEATFAEETRRVKETSKTKLEPMQGIVSLIGRLRDKDVKIGVGTSSDRVRTSQKLGSAGLADLFNEYEIVTQDDVPIHKPEPDVYLECAKRLGVKNEHCVVVEDAPAGIQAAHNAGMKCIAIRTPYVDLAQIEVADMVVDSADEITNEVIQGLTEGK